MASAPALLLSGVRAAVARPSPAGAGAGAVAPPLPVRLFRPARAHLVLAARAPPRSVSVRCARKTGGASVGVHFPAVNALKSAAADAFRPLLDNFNHVRSVKNIADVNDYNIGMPYGVLIASLACYQLLKTAPWTFLDLALGYLFYKLSVVSSQVHRQGFANDFITMIKAAIATIVVINQCHSTSFDVLGFISEPVLQIYLLTFYCYMKGWKQDATYELSSFFEKLQASFRGQT